MRERCMCNPLSQMNERKLKKKGCSVGSLLPPLINLLIVSRISPTQTAAAWLRSSPHRCSHTCLAPPPPVLHSTHSALCPPLPQQLLKLLHCDCSNLSTAALTSPNVAIRA